MTIYLNTTKMMIVALVILAVTACATPYATQLAKQCYNLSTLYKAADDRNVHAPSIKQALACDSGDVNGKLVALEVIGRIGGGQALNRLLPYLTDSNALLRKKAAFSVGISMIGMTDSLTLNHAHSALMTALAIETSAEVRYALTLALGNIGSEQSAASLIRLLNSHSDVQTRKAALQALGSFSVFHRAHLPQPLGINADAIAQDLMNVETEHEASFAMARLGVLSSEQSTAILARYPMLKTASKAFVLRALAPLNTPAVQQLLLAESQHENIDISLPALRGLLKQQPDEEGINLVLELLNQPVEQSLLSQITVVQNIASWLQKDAIQSDVLLPLLESPSSWLAGETMNTLSAIYGSTKQLTAYPIINAQLENTAKQWLSTPERSIQDEANLQRAAINYLVKHADKTYLNKLASMDAPIIANTAQQALGSLEAPVTKPKKAVLTAEQLLANPVVILETTKGSVRVLLSNKTPYTTNSFIESVQNGWYNRTFFHRVIPGFVAQGGSKNGDGSGNVSFSIREELTEQPHAVGTLGMATSGKDTGGGQFFFNLSNNLHLDNNYTVFGTVVSGLDVVMALEQNDFIISARLIE